MENDSLSKVFTGVHFVLFGFNLIDQREVLSKLVNGGGVDVGQYSQSCTHVIVDKFVYDDPVCVAARRDGKKLVTGLWVQHSFDIGLPMETTSIMYKPLKDLNGIPGAKSLIMCLTGYEPQNRDDVMTMVGLMGAQFSKPLVANKVTHLICYKFEGEKYELAKKLKRIKLVNHRWLEDCLRDWELLPEASYSKSGYELEMIESEAKDSEEETDESTMKHFGGRNTKSPSGMKSGLPSDSELSKSAAEVQKIFPVRASFRGSTDVDFAKSTLLIPGDENKLVQPRKPDDTNFSNALGREDTVVFQHDISSELPNKRTRDSVKGRNELTSTSLNAARLPHSDGQISFRSYSRRNPRKSTLPLHSGESLDNVINSSRVPLGEVKDFHDFDASLFKLEQTKDRTDSGFVETFGKGIDFFYEEEELNDQLPQKRMSDISYGSSKSRKMSHDKDLCFVRTPASEMTHFSLSNDDGPYVGENVDLALAQNSSNSTLITKSTSAIEKQLTSATNNYSDNTLATKSADAMEEPPATNLPFSKTVTSEIEQYDSASKTKRTPQKCFRRVKESNLPFSKNVASGSEQDYDASKTKKTPKKYIQRLKESILDRKTHVSNSGMGISENVDGKIEGPHNYCPEVKGTFQIDQNAEGKKLDGPANSNLHKTNRKKMVAKKSLGSRPKLGSTYQKGSIHFLKGTSESDDTKFSVGVSQKHVESPQTVNIEASKIIETEDVTMTAIKDKHKIECMDEENEAPENEEPDLERVLNEEKSEVVRLKNKADKTSEETSVEMQLESNSSKSSVLDEFVSEKAVSGTEPEGPVCGGSIELDEPNVRGDDANGEINTEKKRPKGKLSKRTSHSVIKSNHGQGSKVTENENMEETEKKGKSPSLTAGSKAYSTPDKSEKVTAVEKENKPLVDGDQNVDRSTIKSNAKTMKTSQNAAKVGLKSSMPAEEVLREVKTNPSWFILSGHRLQRKEFQQVIRQLKGRFCRDSHQWSYQATHFIAPDPIRRTEKLFAAAASGRWVLKTDYLTASSQAGRFLSEEPYEWYTKGLSEDGAINLEAPRNWRLLRERTGHGAFYGMRIIIYGECIAPPLDTLKRVIKAGDGTIVATSPPYTRFLNAGVEFAIISPGIPHVDIWVQAFLSNEIPCVVADYLVEYVCKPGYPLEKHVLYNTHAWAEKSFGNLRKRAEEIVEDPTISNDCFSNDIACRVCGSHERGEVMLVCGNEKASIGCGVGMHIDCCNPPLVNIPEDDWFCPECAASRNSMNSSNKNKKRAFSLKRK